MTYQQHLKMDGWKTIVSFFRWPIFRAMFVSGRLDGIGGRVPTHSQVQVPYLPLTMDPFPSKKKSSRRKGAIFALCSDAWACFFQAGGCPQNEAGGHNWGRIFFQLSPGGTWFLYVHLILGGGNSNILIKFSPWNYWGKIHPMWRAYLFRWVGSTTNPYFIVVIGSMTRWIDSPNPQQDWLELADCFCQCVDIVLGNASKHVYKVFFRRLDVYVQWPRPQTCPIFLLYILVVFNYWI